jgi:hypothetical protein
MVLFDIHCNKTDYYPQTIATEMYWTIILQLNKYNYDKLHILIIMIRVEQAGGQGLSWSI